jgi:squalene-hopene/tetraprenyl-beta-curcumene cyclase
LSWLSATQNADGGWGDTVFSKSNISTTSLVWAAFAGNAHQHADSIKRCEAWLLREAGGTEPDLLAKAIADSYGADRTFSVPILTTLALRNRLGASPDAWRLVPQLPFELASFPQRWYARLQMPVVSYALPALISIGLARHRWRPSRNPVLRAARQLVQSRTLRTLTRLQPSSGGFLEATPLTSFVTLGMVGAGQVRHGVVAAGVNFLVRSVRADGSWPIDTNLATWLTTLAVNALSSSGAREPFPSPDDSASVYSWLTSQQCTVEHPYTLAAPGGWAWTDLPGGVPDADDTAGALLALWKLSGPSSAAAGVAGIRWLLDLQNKDGGIPTFCRGWGVLPFDRSSTDLTAHALRAWAAWYDTLPVSLQHRVRAASSRAVQFLRRNQRPDGAWAPLWFGNQHATGEKNLTYGTCRVLVALATVPGWLAANAEKLPNLGAAVAWLLTTQNEDGGWGGATNTPSSIEETALALEALCAMLQALKSTDKAALLPKLSIARTQSQVARGFQWLMASTQLGHKFPPTPIGFYFARLWYYERLYPVIFTLAAAGRALALNEHSG